MKRTVEISDYANDHCVTVTFKEGRKKIASFQFWNYHGYGEVLQRQSVDFVKHGLLPKQTNGFIKL